MKMGGNKRRSTTRKEESNGVIHGNGGVKGRTRDTKRHEAAAVGRDISWEEPWSLKWKLCVILIAVSLTILHRYHLSSLFESDRHFSHLSDMEREMTHRTEMGLYFSYYKTLVNAAGFMDGLHQITSDNVSEYGHTINTLKRFNLYPELYLGWMYRSYKWFAERMRLKTQQCWETNRGDGLPPIVSCEGMGNIHYFYINHVFILAGTVTGALFLMGTLMSGSILGGALAVCGFMFNHGEATRVQWTPPLRESFGYPIFLIQMLVVSYIVKYGKVGISWSLLVATLTALFMMVWQFAQFALSTQVGALFVCYLLDYVSAKVLRSIASGLMLGFVLGFVFLFGNEMLLTSLFLSSIVMTQIILFMDDKLYRISVRPLFWFTYIPIFSAGTIGIKFALGKLLNISDDAHIFEILYSKFSNFSNFHTRLYTCAPEFDFLGMEAPWKLTYTLLLPTAVCVTVLFLLLLLMVELSAFWRRAPPYVEKHYAEVVYNVLQAAAFTVIAVLIMRLKLFWTPHLCVLSSLLASRRLCFDIFGGLVRPLHQRVFCVAILAIMAFAGVKNLKAQWAIMGEYSNVPQEELFDWVTQRTPKGAVFAGTMPTMANLKLSTERPIVNHPHYEDSGLRNRTMNVYTLFSRKSPEQVHALLRGMHVDYVVFEYGWCGVKAKPACSLPVSWDHEDPENKGKAALCDVLNVGKRIEPFKQVYSNNVYKVLKL